MSAPIVIHGSTFSTCTQMALTVAAERGVKVDLKNVDMSKGEHKQPAFLALQPWGKIPALVQGDYTIYESRAISSYLNELGSTGRDLAGTSAQERGKVQQWVQLNTHTYTPIVSKVLFQRVWGPTFFQKPTDEAAVKAAVEELQTPFDILEAQLGKTPYLAGSEFTMADLPFLPYLGLLTTTPEWAGLTASRPNITKWWNLISSRPSWKSVAAQIGK